MENGLGPAGEKTTNYSQLFAAFMHRLRDDRSLVDVLESGINGRSAIASGASAKTGPKMRETGGHTYVD